MWLYTGTFGDRPGLYNDTQCSPCTGGWYCHADRLTAPTGLCLPGFYCAQVIYAFFNKCIDN